MKTSENVSELVPALINAKKSIGPAKKDRKNFHGGKFADLSSVHEACDAALAENNLIVIQDVEGNEKSVLVSTRLIHSSGQWMEVGPLCLPLTKNDPQAVGSCITYGRRYAISSLLCIVTEEDDDANSSMPLHVSKKIEVKTNHFPQQEKKYIDEPVPKTYETLDHIQLKELTNALSFCSTDYEKSFKGNIKTHWKIDDYKDIKKTHFDGLLRNIHLHLESEKKKKQETHV